MVLALPANIQVQENTMQNRVFRAAVLVIVLALVLAVPASAGPRPKLEVRGWSGGSFTDGPDWYKATRITWSGYSDAAYLAIGAYYCDTTTVQETCWYVNGKSDPLTTSDGVAITSKDRHYASLTLQAKLVDCQGQHRWAPAVFLLNSSGGVLARTETDVPWMIAMNKCPVHW
jgi:hypothetical protein